MGSARFRATSIETNFPRKLKPFLCFVIHPADLSPLLIHRKRSGRGLADGSVGRVGTPGGRPLRSPAARQHTSARHCRSAGKRSNRGSDQESEPCVDGEALSRRRPGVARTGHPSQQQPSGAGPPTWRRRNRGHRRACRHDVTVPGSTTVDGRSQPKHTAGAARIQKRFKTMVFQYEAFAQLLDTRSTFKRHACWLITT